MPPDSFVDVLLSASLNWHIFKNTTDNSFLTARHSRMYGRNIGEVEKGMLSHATLTVGERNGKGGSKEIPPPRTKGFYN